MIFCVAFEENLCSHLQITITAKHKYNEMFMRKILKPNRVERHREKFSNIYATHEHYVCKMFHNFSIFNQEVY